MIINIIYLLIAVMLIALNAFFASGEFALVKLRRTRLQELAQKGGAREKLALKAHESIDEYLSTLQIGITMTSLALGWVGEPSVGRIIAAVLPEGSPTGLSYAVSFILAFGIITCVHVIFGEQVPKLFSIKYPERVLMRVITPIYYFNKVMKPLRTLLTSSAHGAMRALGINPQVQDAAPSQEELRMVLSQAQDQGKLSLRRLMMFENLFDFEHITVREIMTPRPKITALKKSNTWPQNLEIIKPRMFSRYPMYDDTLDDAKEYLLIKYMSMDSLSAPAGAPIEEKYTYPLLNLAEDTPVEAALRQFQQNKRHQALVRGVDGTVVGLLTLEDVLEELVGEIRDESERPAPASLSNFLLPTASTMALKSTDKFNAFEELLQALHKTAPVFDFAAAQKSIIRRELLMSCAFGRGVAMPHARIAGINAPLVALGAAKKGIDFQCGGEKANVKLIFLILTPLKEPSSQLKLLAEIAAISENKITRERLLKAKTPNEAAEIILAFENTIPD